jgi:hypothetical protein
MVYPRRDEEKYNGAFGGGDENSVGMFGSLFPCEPSAHANKKGGPSDRLCIPINRDADQ